MKTGDFLKACTLRAAMYRDKCAQTLKLNEHMHDYRGPAPSQELVDAILVDFINFMGMTAGCDYALDVNDLHDRLSRGRE